METWQKLLKQLKLEYMQKSTPQAFEASGGYTIKVLPYTDKTANGLTKCIEDFIKYQGGYANRISTTGLMRKIKGEMKYTKGNSNKGAADVRILFNGRCADIEIKIGRDKQSDAQKKEQARIERAGGLYFIARNFPDFLEWWQLQGFEVPQLKQLVK
jgi:hypothetical protein